MLVLNAVKLRHNYLSVLFEGRFWYQACLCLIYLYCRSAVDAKLLIICLFFCIGLMCHITVRQVIVVVLTKL